MNTPFQNEKDILESINLTTKLEQSLKKILTNKKKTNISGRQCQEICKQHEKIMNQLETLRTEKELLANDNQILTRELMNHKQQIRELSKEIKELKKYVNFLQGYNSSLKKQMAFWVKKPRTQPIMEEKDPKYELLYQEIDHLKKMNDIREKQLSQIENTVIVKPGPNIFNKDFYVKSSSTNKKSMTKNSINFSKNHEKECLSCNRSQMLNKSKKMNKNKSFTNKRKKLCSCHKSYIQTSDFLY